MRIVIDAYGRIRTGDFCAAVPYVDIDVDDDGDVVAARTVYSTRTEESKDVVRAIADLSAWRVKSSRVVAMLSDPSSIQIYPRYKHLFDKGLIPVVVIYAACGLSNLEAVHIFMKDIPSAEFDGVNYKLKGSE